MSAIPRTLLNESELGMAVGHSEAISMVERFLTSLEGPVHEPATRRSIRTAIAG